MSYYDRPGMIAMGATASAPAMRCPSKDEVPGSTRRPIEPRPAVDDPLLRGENGHELLEGKLIFSPPAHEPHGTLHIDLAAVLRTHVTPAYRGALDMLTRVSETSEIAPDASIYPVEREAGSGGRKLEELAFEIVSEQAMSVPTRKAHLFIERGVRRMFCIDISKRRVLEWSRTRDDWDELSLDAWISDVCFVRPLAVRSLVDAALVDDTVAEGLLARKNRRIEAALAAAKVEASAEALLQVLAARNLLLSDTDLARVRSCSDPRELARWTARAAVATRPEQVLADGQ